MSNDPLNESCSNCRFFFDKATTAFKEADGVCRRRAPVGPAIPAGHGWQAFPPMASWHWCGEWEPEQKRAEAQAAAVSQAA